MRDIDAPPDEGYPDVRPEDSEERTRYLEMFRGRYAEDIASLAPEMVESRVHAALRLCPQLYIRHPRDVLRFLGLVVLAAPRLRGSPFLDKIVHRILTATADWSATKRLDFLEKHVLERPLPTTEPDFGPWWDGELTSLLEP